MITFVKFLQTFFENLRNSYRTRQHYREVSRTFHRTIDQLETYSIQGKQVIVVRVPYEYKPDASLLKHLERSLSNRNLTRVYWDMKRHLLIACAR